MTCASEAPNKAAARNNIACTKRTRRHDTPQTSVQNTRCVSTRARRTRTLRHTRGAVKKSRPCAEARHVVPAPNAERHATPTTTASASLGQQRATRTRQARPPTSASVAAARGTARNGAQKKKREKRAAACAASGGGSGSGGGGGGGDALYANGNAGGARRRTDACDATRRNATHSHRAPLAAHTRKSRATRSSTRRRAALSFATRHRRTTRAANAKQRRKSPSHRKKKSFSRSEVCGV